MAYDELLVTRVRQLLGHLPDVEEKKMFGSIGFMVNGKLCMGIGNHRGHVMMLRVGPDVYEEALQKKGAEPTIMRGRIMKGYVSLIPDAVERQKALEEWVAMALDFNLRLV